MSDWKGFASMSPEKRRELASKGGRAAIERGTQYEFTYEDRSIGGQISGTKIAAIPGRMRELGRLSGRKCAEIPGRMAEMGRKGGIAKKLKNNVQ